MKITSPKLNRLAGLLASSAARVWMNSLDYKAAYYDPTADPAHPECVSQKIYIFWHENILFPICMRGHCNVAMLLSRHKDANLLSESAGFLGFEYVRGSTFEGGTSAIRAMLRMSRDKHLTMTPDGPRGPRRTMSQGPIYMASKLGLPLVLMGYGYDRPWRLGSWDRFAIPKPCSRARAVWSPAIHIPPRLDRDGIEHYRLRMEQLLNRLTCEAEAWAESGTRKVGERPMRRDPGKRTKPGGRHAVAQVHLLRTVDSPVETRRSA